MNAPDWAFWVVGWTALGAGLALGAWALFTDRAKHRRCPRCRYNMTGIESRRCPECGCRARKEKQLFKTRRRWRWALIALVLVLGGGGTAWTPSVKTYGVVGSIPNSFVLFAVRYGHSTWAIQEAGKRFDYTKRNAFLNRFGPVPGGAFRTRAQRRIVTEAQRQQFRQAFIDTVLSNGALSVRAQAMAVLTEQGLLSRNDLAFLRNRIENDEPHIGRLAMHALSNVLQVIAGQDETLSNVIAFTNESNPMFRRAAAVALGRVNQNRQRAIKVLTDLVASDDPFVANAAVQSLNRLPAPTPAVRDVLLDKLIDPQFEPIGTSVRLLRSAGTDSNEIRAALRARLADESALHLKQTAMALSGFGVDAIGDLPVLWNRYQHADCEHRIGFELAILRAVNAVNRSDGPDFDDGACEGLTVLREAAEAFDRAHAMAVREAIRRIERGCGE